MHSIEMTRSTPFRDIVAFLKMYRLFKKIKPAIVHSHTPKAGLLPITPRPARGCYIHFAGLPLVESRNKKVTVTFVRLTYFVLIAFIEFTRLIQLCFKYELCNLTIEAYWEW